MIKIKFAKFILVFALALVSINACYPSELECADNTEIKVLVKKDLASSHQESSSEQSQSTSEKETHYCLCSLTCHAMFINFSTMNTMSVYTLAFLKEFQYTTQNYPEVSYSLEKPPTV